MQIPLHILEDGGMGIEEISQWAKKHFGLRCPEEACASPDVDVTFSGDRRIKNAKVPFAVMAITCRICGRITSINGNGKDKLH